jgi:putative DNA primase/helicase
MNATVHVAADDEPRPPEFSDDALALSFAARHADDLRYVAAWSKWLHWTGTHWLIENTLLAFDLVRTVCRETAAGCDNFKIAATIASTKTVAAVERLAKADRRLAASVDQWDADPWLLNTPEGVIDLSTGILRLHDPFDYLTRITAVSPSGDCPMWRNFLDRVTCV